ncbi:alpha/beta-hydrolase [Poronia punctata]|nr:alpha/beta-hydrolase [Poronia punctata]
MGMKDAPQLPLPSWPPRVLFARRGLGRPGANIDTGNINNRTDINAQDYHDSEANTTPDMLGSESSSGNYSYERLDKKDRPSWHKSRRTRLSLLGALTFGIVTIILLSTLLSRHGVASFDNIFKKTCTINLPQGNYLGQVIGPSKSSPRPIQAYLGIPYAESTEGKNRLQPPQPLKTKASTGVLHHALVYGKACPQSKPNNKAQGEKCLNANIFRPHFGDDAESIAAEEQRLGVDSKKLPVVVYVHGGGFNMGSGKDRDMASFAAFADSPIVALSFNYRVGAFGFLPSSVMAKEGLLNLGLKDQQLFFEWMRENLPSIGGDPDNVTIMGLSAGAHSIGHHLISYSPENKLVPGPPPFQKAILESGGATGRAVFVPDHPLHEQQFHEFLTYCGLGNVPDDEIVARLRQLTYKTLHLASRAMWDRWSDTLRWPFQPVIDGPGGVIPDFPIRSWEKGNVLRIPLLTGFNTNEGAYFVPEGENQPDAVRNLMSSIIPGLGVKSLETLDKLYPSLETPQGQSLYTSSNQSTRHGTQFWRLDDAYAHYAYICPVLQTATNASTAAPDVPVYVYHYAALSARFGATDHADESPIVAHDMKSIGRYPGVVATANAMTGAFTRFAVTGNPSLSYSGEKAEYEWPRYISPFSPNAEKEAGQVALFGKGNDEQLGHRGTRGRGVPVQTITLTDREKAECQFWWSHTVLSEGYGDGSMSLAPANVKVKAKL